MLYIWGVEPKDVVMELEGRIFDELKLSYNRYIRIFLVSK